MKKIFLTSFLAFSLGLISCKSDAKKEKSTETKEEVKEDTQKNTADFQVEKAQTNINFTAYKTTDKVAVGGQFKKIDILNGGDGNSVKEAINNTEFSIPVSSLATKDTSRDYKIRKFFFGVMSNTKLLSGKLSIVDDANGIASITMNGETKDVPFTYTIVNNEFNMQSIIDVNTWNATAALASLNKVCEDLHRGADGISKTWSEVALNITTKF